MGKTISTELAAHIEGEVLTTANLWGLTRPDGGTFFFTDHDTDIVYSGQRYIARTGFMRTQIASDTTMAVDNLEVMGIFDSEDLDENEMRGGLFDGSEVLLRVVNFEDLTMGDLKLRRGTLGEVILTEKGYFRTELRGMNQRLQQMIGELYGPQCRADLGDLRCKVDLATFTFSYTIDSVTSKRNFTATGTGQVDNYFRFGAVTFTSGDNTGMSMEVKQYLNDGNDFTLFLPMSFPVNVGDTFTVYHGCDKLVQTCLTFDNVVNFRGEPWIPGPDYMNSYPIKQ